MKFFVSCAKGLEYLLADELVALGCTRATATVAGANAEGGLVDAQRAVLWSRLASRVLWPLADYECADEHALYAGARAVRAIGWLQLCCSENPAADRAHFLKLYESMRSKQKETKEIEQVMKIAGVGELIRALAGKTT